MKNYLILEDKRLINIVDIFDKKIIKSYNFYNHKALNLNNYDNETIKKVIEENPREFLFSTETKEITTEKLEINIGNYYSRIYRPIGNIVSIPFMDGHLLFKPALYLPVNLTEYYNSINQVEYLIELLKRIFRVVQPVDGNNQTFGIEIRNIIILICTEIEAQWKGILKANNYSKNKAITKDYVKLKDVLKLKDYDLALRNFPNIKSVSPYSNWDPKNPTQSLTWYDAYNKIKHDREGQMKLATIQNAVDSIIALIIILISQYGPNIIFETELKNYFLLEKEPIWNDVEKYYPPRSLENQDWKEIINSSF